MCSWHRLSVTAQGSKVTAALDGVKLGTPVMWPSQWRSATRPGPHDIALQLGQTQPVTGLGYLPRQDGTPNGGITRYTVSTSTDGVHFTQVASGTWANTATAKSATLPAAQAKYVGPTALAGVNGFTSAAEITIQ